MLDSWFHREREREGDREEGGKKGERVKERERGWDFKRLFHLIIGAVKSEIYIPGYKFSQKPIMQSWLQRQNSLYFGGPQSFFLTFSTDLHYGG